ncbi:anaerobic ribonucleoside-triphosphate reductase activating protein [candidate division WOR-3 bacterium]|nr:anaerobic ribonucleoside-triphosphate reductase activating protein [candidate division WOR-3 bacterium]
MIRAMIETSLIDWDGKLTTVLFFDKCNFMCPFCQNWDLMLNSEKFPLIEWRDIERKLLARKKWIDGVVLTGGEPFVYGEEVLSVSRGVKAMGFLLKIDTNGSYPDALQELISKDLVDYVAMDIKAPLDERYNEAAGRNIDIKKIERSVRLLMEGRVNYEFRTTCVPGMINEGTLGEIGERIRGARTWVLQQYVPENAYDEKYRQLTAVTAGEARTFVDIARRYAVNAKWRGRSGN